ncbi:PREDICTED: ubiquitin thioesterase otubain-like [Brassica oleracea var. oleracea]|uniref:ubiquitin thioesterase otubain-like n=1 Tax=Brassica oleracea var. oleracea TaxID=109376 RepID=UPI0006A73BDB|nr:PREDICTED: ubiquitin thioesterase otubain-like [Brassica oleracea var. oleracea]
MQNHNDAVKDDEAVKVGNCSVENVQSFQEEAAKFPYVGDKEPLSSLAAEYQAGSPILLEKIKEHILESQDGAEVDRIKLRRAVSDYIVMFFRFVTAGEIRTRAEFFEPFITGLSNSTVDQFCKISVEPMGEESDHIHITALSDALGVAIRVVYLDRSSCDSGGVTVNHHDFVPVGTNEKQEEASAPFITLLYRPGHYDILYPKPSCKVLNNVEKMIV